MNQILIIDTNYDAINGSKSRLVLRFFLVSSYRFSPLSEQRRELAATVVSNSLKWFIAPPPVLFLLNDEPWCDFAWVNNQSIYSKH